MPNKSEINRELVRAFNVILHYNNAIATNLVVEKGSCRDHIVISFDENMNKEKCMKYLSQLKESIVDKHYGEYEKGERYDVARLSFDMDSFPFKGDKKLLKKDKGRYKFSIPIDNKVVFNLKCLIANEFVHSRKNYLVEKYPDSMDKYWGEELEVRDRKNYLYAIRFDSNGRELQDMFKDSLLSKIREYRKHPEEALEIKDNEIRIKSNVFDEIQFINNIVREISMIEYRVFEISNDDNPRFVDGKFSLIDLCRKAVRSVNTTMRVPCSDKERPDYLSEGEKSILIPAFQYDDDHLILLEKEEVDHLNKIFGMDVLNNMEDYIDESVLSKLDLNGKGIYAIDCANPDIAYCVMNKVMESSVINEDYKLSIDPARVPAMKPQTLAPSEEKVETDKPSADTSVDSGFVDSPDSSVIGKSHTGNSSKFFRVDHYVEGKSRDDASDKDSGFLRSSARSSPNKPKTKFNQPSVSQPDQCSSKKRTSTSKKSVCCVL
ncbi:hypothetical protein [Wolbachia endosymbiont of Trichogramma pretiosum]|uniref:hypothetical protein n=1 Tax=Wolbachia endosymbiont of Trichogramma pretiosum TaxID=125593 RepID=UPI0008387857|nr:hypothetical protein [Wolbachia endosymbiont of Trichogramma pretiosum]OCA06792.1 hypothetical protein wTpre_1139 [Wolbachia endosymbiont of Trichogramma pretiosum]